jgi:ABC-type microcin C transport system permease subunit YejB
MISADNILIYIFIPTLMVSIVFLVRFKTFLRTLYYILFPSLPQPSIATLSNVKKEYDKINLDLHANHISHMFAFDKTHTKKYNEMLLKYYEFIIDDRFGLDITMLPSK